MSKLKEEEIIKKALLLQLPWIAVGILACFFPYVYAVVPSSQGITCICSFYDTMYRDKHDYLAMHRGETTTYSIILQMNMAMYAVIHFIFITGLVCMLYSIRNV